MTSEHSQAIELIDDTRLNVASLLLEGVGSTRDVVIQLWRFPLDSDLVAHDVVSRMRLTRLRSALLAQGVVEGSVELECARCLRPYEQPFTESFTEQFRQSVDVRSGERPRPHHPTILAELCIEPWRRPRDLIDAHRQLDRPERVGIDGDRSLCDRSRR